MTTNFIITLDKKDIEYYKELWETNDIEEIKNIFEGIFYDDIYIKRDFFQTIDLEFKINA